jgi:hypothetical protein
MYTAATSASAPQLAANNFIRATSQHYAGTEPWSRLFSLGPGESDAPSLRNGIDELLVFFGLRAPGNNERLSTSLSDGMELGLRLRNGFDIFANSLLR